MKARGRGGKQPFQPAALLSPSLQQQLESARRRTVTNNAARLDGEAAVAAAAVAEFDRSELMQRRRRLLSAAVAAAVVRAGDNRTSSQGSGRDEGARDSGPLPSRLPLSSSRNYLGGRLEQPLPVPPGEGQKGHREEEGGVGGPGVAIGIASGVSKRSVLSLGSEAYKTVGAAALAPNGSEAYSRKDAPPEGEGAAAGAGAATGAGPRTADSSETAEIGGVSPVPRLDSPDGDSKKEGGEEEDGSAERGWRIDPDDPIPPPGCPSRLVELLEEALHVEARSKKTAAMPGLFPGGGAVVAAAAITTAASIAELPAAGTSGYTTREDDRKDNAAPAAGWSPAVVAALIADGAAAAANRARSRAEAERGDGLGNTLGRARWEASLGSGVLPTWLGGVTGLEWGGGTTGKKTAETATAGEGAAAAETINPAMLPRSVVAQQALGSGFKAIAAYRAHEVEGWNGGGAAGSNSSGDKDPPGAAGVGTSKANGGEGSPPRSRSRSRSATGPPANGAGEDSEDEGERPLPVRFTGFTWDGITVVAKETVAGCARTARSAPPALLSAPPPLETTSWGSADPGMDYDDSALSEYRAAEDTAQDAAVAARAEAAAPEKDGGRQDIAVGRRGDLGVGVGVGGGGSGRVGQGGGGKARPQCLKVEAAFVPTETIVVDVIVPVRETRRDKSRVECGFG